MNENIKWGAAAVAVVGLSIGAVLWFSKRERAEPPAEPVVAVPAKPGQVAPPPVAESDIAHPLPPSENTEPLPPLNESDAPAQSALAELVGPDFMARSVLGNELVRHIVVTLDNLSTEKAAERLRPLKPVPGAFAVTGPEDERELDPANYERYKPLVEVFRSTDTKQLVATYTRYYPLLQEAYENLGHPPQYFNDRVIEVIDHLLATPEVSGPIVLAQPNVLYTFADPKLEAMSAGQKALVRMGSENAGAVKAKLRELRAALAAQPKDLGKN